MIPLRPPARLRRLALLLAPLALAACRAAQPDEPAVEASVHPGINDSYLAEDIEIEEWLARFERAGRTVYDLQDEIVASLGLTEGDRVADVGSGTGLFTSLLAREVGSSGRVYAVDIVPAFLEHVDARMRELGLEQVSTVLGNERSVELPDGSVDVAFLCDVYHHFEYPQSSLASLRSGLRPGGELVVVDFERIPGVSSDWLIDHVRAGREVFLAEIESAGFELLEQRSLGDDTYLLRFRRPG